MCCPFFEFMLAWNSPSDLEDFERHIHLVATWINKLTCIISDVGIAFVHAIVSMFTAVKGYVDLISSGNSV